jgi:PBSX family phage portal protein
VAERKVKGAEDEDKPGTQIGNVRMSSGPSKADTKSTDPFKKSIKELTEIKPAIQKKATRAINKALDLEKTNKGDGGTATKQVELDETTGYNYLGVVEPPFNLEYLAKLPAVSAPHYAAIQAKTANIIGLGARLVESPKTKRKLNRMKGEEKIARFREQLQQAKDEILEYLEKLNDDDSFIEVISKAWFDYEATGQGYLEIGRKATGEIGYLGHIPSTTMRVRRKRDGYVQISSNKVVYFRNFGEDTPNPITSDENPNEIIMFKKYSATNSFYGQPDIMAASQPVAGNEFAARFNLDYFENKAVPRHVIVLKGATLSSQAETNIVEFFDTALKGQNHRSLYVPLPGDTAEEKVSLEIKPVEAGVQDQSFEKYKKSNIQEILFAHRVPASKIGLTEGMSVATALDAAKTFKDQVCVPQQRMAAKKVNRVVSTLTDVFVLEFNELSLTDEDTQSKIDERNIRNKIVVPNEIRARMGLPGYKGGDKPVELKPEAAAQAGATRQRDSERSAATSTTDANGRGPKGEGRVSPTSTKE